MSPSHGPKLSRLKTANTLSYAVLASALGNLDQLNEAHDAVGEALQRKSDLSLTYLKTTLLTKQPDGLDTYLDGLRKAGLPE